MHSCSEQQSGELSAVHCYIHYWYVLAVTLNQFWDIKF